MEKKWVWVLEPYTPDEVYPAIVQRVKCEKCGKENIFTNSYQFGDAVPLSNLTEGAVIYVPKIPEWESRSGLSWTIGGGFFTEKKDLIKFSVPKTLGDEIIEPEYCVIIHETDHTVISTSKPLNKDAFIMEKTTTCFECLRKELGEPDYQQGNLSIWKVSDSGFVCPSETGARGLWFRKCEIGNYYKDYAEVFNHKIRAEQVCIRDGTKLAFVSYKNEITIEATDHDTLTLPAGAYIGYHPRPRRGLD